jgi:hypothetical protein
VDSTAPLGKPLVDVGTASTTPKRSVQHSVMRAGEGSTTSARSGLIGDGDSTIRRGQRPRPRTLSGAGWPSHKHGRPIHWPQACVRGRAICWCSPALRSKPRSRPQTFSPICSTRRRSRRRRPRSRPRCMRSPFTHSSDPPRSTPSSEQTAAR